MEMDVCVYMSILLFAHYYYYCYYRFGALLPMYHLFIHINVKQAILMM